MTDDVRRDARAEAYLWDPTAPPDEDVAAVERSLAPLRVTPADLPSLAEASPARPVRHRRQLVAVGAAAAVLLGIGAGLGVHRWTWPDGRAWTVRAAGDLPERLEVGRALRLGPADHAEIAIARIGTMDVRPGSTITLRSTASNHHRLVLTEGMIRVSVWAPPGAVLIKTPAGDLIDLGCAFDLRVDTAGVAQVSVRSGWVQLDNVHGEALVPAGASSTMVPGARPGAPVFDDATPEFRAGVRRLEASLLAGSLPSVSYGFLGESRPKDVLTLLLVAANAPAGAARPLLERAAALHGPPPGVTPAAIAAGDRAQLWRWHDALDLPPPKSWVWNWRDGFGTRRAEDD